MKTNQIIAPRLEAGGTMANNLQIDKDITSDLLNRLTSDDESERESAVEALEVSTDDDSWRPAELIDQGGIDILENLLDDTNLHIVVSALNTIIAIAGAGGEEALISSGTIAKLNRMQDHPDKMVRDRVTQALWLLTPEVEEVVTTKPQDEY